MNQISNPVKEAVWFFVLTLGLVFLIFWGPLAFLGIPGANLSGASGPTWAVLLFVLGGFTPSSMALIMTWRIDGKEGLRLTMKRLSPRTVSLKWHLAILLVIGLATLSQLLIIALLGYSFDLSLFLSRIIFLLPLLILGPLSEELGWRGFALGRLQTRSNALISSLIVGFFWGLWHLPLFYIPGTAQYLYDMSFLGFLVGLLAISVLYTWAFNNTGASIWSAVFFHWIYTYALDTMSAGLTTPLAAFQILQYVPYIIIAVAVTAVWGTKTLTRGRDSAKTVTA
jgi:membrane protease YdiL (CAAX protease family)